MCKVENCLYSVVNVYEYVGSGREGPRGKEGVAQPEMIIGSRRGAASIECWRNLIKTRCKKAERRTWRESKIEGRRKPEKICGIWKNGGIF
jgi:hypothetical protein